MSRGFQIKLVLRDLDRFQQMALWLIACVYDISGSHAVRTMLSSRSNTPGLPNI